MPFQALMRFFRPKGEEGAATYREIVDAARQPLWYRNGGVPDTLEGRFRVLSSITALQIVRLEQGDEKARRHSAALTETWIADMEAQLRESGVSDPAIGKRVRALVGSLATRTARWREAVADDTLEAAARANLYGDEPATDHAIASGVGELIRLWEKSRGATDLAVMEGTSL